MRVLVTGGAGFIGSHIVDALTGGGIDVVVLDNLDPAAHSGVPTYLNESAEYRWADCRSVDAWTESLVGVDAVCHQAGKVGLGVDFGDVEDYVTSNDGGTAAGLLAMHRLGFDGPIVLASSMVVYGEGRYTCETHGVVRPGPRAAASMEAGDFEPPCPTCGAALRSSTIPEDAPLDPRNVYAATKLHQEHLVAAYAREHGNRATMLRYHNVYGSRMPRDTPYAGVASIFRSAYESGRAPRVTEDGTQRRDFVDVRDVAAVNVRCLIDDRACGPYNVASGEPHTVGEMARALGAAFGVAEGDAMWPVVTGAFRLGDVRHIVASTARLRGDLGFAPSVGFATGMTEFANAPLRAPVSR